MQRRPPRASLISLRRILCDLKVLREGHRQPRERGATA
jgi:hypothetical protein